MEYTKQRIVALSPVTALKKTVEHFTSTHAIDFPMTFENRDIIKSEWSAMRGIGMFILDFFLYLGLGIILELTINFDQCFKRCFIRKVKFVNTDENVIKITSLKSKEISYEFDSLVYNFTIEKSKVYFLISNENAQKTKLMEMLAGERPCEDGGSIEINDSNFFVRDEHP